MGNVNVDSITAVPILQALDALANRPPYKYEASASWVTQPGSLRETLRETLADWPVLAQMITDRDPKTHESITYDFDDMVMSITLYSGGAIYVRAIAIYPLTPEGLFDMLCEKFPEVEPADNEVKINFWMLTTDGPSQSTRTIVVPEWEAISNNYESSAAEFFEEMVNAEEWDSHRGQLAIWHGPPGTGKTYALRALAARWREWCQIYYITDAENFLGNSSYLTTVCLDETGNKWKLIVLEDAGELLSADARQQVGQGLSRLLNMVDGIMGQGLKLAILVTTNEKLGKLHPAVSRPGRCAYEINFGPLPMDEANEWLVLNGCSERVHGEKTLAELYSMVEKRERETQHSNGRQIGFA